ncbi:hypothetical protein PsorP6_019468 [Peronosclerospora sorghi]|nr:hypothetical protein PsorP6_019468 [Peronosclerospora sorghi]
MNRAVIGDISVAFILYEKLSLCGYLHLGADTRDNILLNFSTEYILHHKAVKMPLLSDAYHNVQYLCAFCQDPVKNRWFRLGFPPHFYNAGVLFFLLQSTAPILVVNMRDRLPCFVQGLLSAPLVSS